MTDKDISHDEMVEVVSRQFKTDAEATTYLNQHPLLYPYIVESIAKIKAIFGSYIELELHLVKDPEDAAYRRLFGYIWVSASVDDAIDKLNQLDDEYILDLPDDIASHLNFDVRY